GPRERFLVLRDRRGRGGVGAARRALRAVDLARVRLDELVDLVAGRRELAVGGVGLLQRLLRSLARGRERRLVGLERALRDVAGVLRRLLCGVDVLLRLGLGLFGRQLDRPQVGDDVLDRLVVLRAAADHTPRRHRGAGTAVRDDVGHAALEA